MNTTVNTEQVKQSYRFTFLAHGFLPSFFDVVAATEQEARTIFSGYEKLNPDKFTEVKCTLK